MKVTTLQSTPNPEELVCTAARGDYYDGFVGDDPFRKVMDGVPTKEEHRAKAAADTESYYNEEDLLENPPEEDMLGGAVLARARKRSLLERLFRRGHWGPFEHPQITLAVKGVSRSCMAQITRHRHASFDVQSQRYVDFGEKDDPVKVPKSLTDPNHATRGEGEVELEGIDDDYAQQSYEDKAAEMVDWYDRLVDHGMPKEDARFLLPIGTKVNFTVSVNARMLLHIEDMRKTGEAQWEIREMTEMIHDEFEDWMPVTAELYEEHGPHKLAP
jgi:thymidylate synthase (FAD)